jgi:hypothetical protein
MPCVKLKLKLLHINCHVLEFTQDKAKNVLQRNPTLIGKWDSSDELHLRVPVGNPTLIGLDLPLPTLVGVTERRRKILTCTQVNKNNKSKSLSDYAQ